MDETETTLSRRGLELAAGPSIRDTFSAFLESPYDPETNPRGFINMGVAENYVMLPEIMNFSNKNLKLHAENFSYGEGPWGTRRIRQAMAQHMNKTFHTHTPVDPDDILFASGVTSLSEMLGFTIGDPGDGVLFSRPIYQSFKVDFGIKAKMKSIFVSFGEVDQFSPAAAGSYENALIAAEGQGIHIRALMLCNPHNPLGQCYPKETIIALMRLCDKYTIHLLCDELYAATVYEVPDKYAVKFTSVLSFDHSDYIGPDYVHVLYSMSKDFAAGGLRLGCIYTRNKQLMRAMSAIGQFHWSGGPSEHIATLVLENEEWLDGFLRLGRERLAHANRITRKLLDEVGVKYHQGANAGFFLWIDLRPYLPTVPNSEDVWASEEQLVKKLMANKVYITAGQNLSAEEPGWFRLIFAHDERVIKAGLRRVFEVAGLC